MVKPSFYCGSLNQKLLSSVTTAPRRCLEIGCGTGRLGRALKERFPRLFYTGVDISRESLSKASKVLDQVIELDVSSLSEYEFSKYLGTDPFDLIILGDILEHLPSPHTILQGLHQVSCNSTELKVCVPNVTHISVLERLLTGDFAYDTMGILDDTHLRFYSPSGMTKQLLDTGWLPDIVDTHKSKISDQPHVHSLIHAAFQLGIPAKKAASLMATVQVIFSANRYDQPLGIESADWPRITVIVPVNRQWQFELNIARSPGLKEIGAEIIPIYESNSAAEAYELGAQSASHPWRLFAHQDLYIPKGCGWLITRKILEMERNMAHAWPAGFVGVESHGDDSSTLNTDTFRGMIVDRSNLMAYAPSSAATSIDPLGVLLHQDTLCQIDPALGWHLWTTDLCLQAEKLHGKPCTNIFSVPVFHNSLLVEVPQSWHSSAKKLAEKWPEKKTIHTLCGVISKKS
ncbi:class I SAM-dependent methyltransferase [Synechococcus sp. CCY9202]|uniref:class I SAM-dependent methyltransferase n=1 Tax=Synechococcus sp. CCY9202 TaxID=174698 RepID=UPI002B1EF0A6|nr:methyltransferase [Synechococcus sp. CCY9202]